MLERWLPYVIPIIVLLVLAQVVRSRRSDPNYIAVGHCRKCGWQGKVSRYKPICRQCNSTIRLPPA